MEPLRKCLRNHFKQIIILEVSQKDFVLINLAVVTVLVILFILSRRPKPPTPLSMGEAFPKPKTPVTNENAKKATEDQPIPKNRLRHLNCLFVYNGHSWDAYEVLGVPAGCSYEMAKAGYLDIKGKSSPESYEFLDAAIDAIEKLQRRN